MKSVFKSFFFVSISLLMLVSCEKIFDWDYEAVEETIPVVEGIVTNEMKNHSVKLSLVRSDPNSQPLIFQATDVKVIIGNSEYLFTESISEPGYWISDDAFMGYSGQEIQLQFSFNGKTYLASDAMVPVSPSGRPVFIPSEDDSSRFSLFASSSILYSPEPAMWEFIIHWEFLPGYETAPIDSCVARIFYYDLKVLDQGQIFAPLQQIKYFPEGAEVFLTKYSLSENHREFRRSLLLETEWRGGLMDVSPGIIFTNVSDGGAGYFGACSVVRDTFFITGN